MARTIATLCVLALLAGASASENPRFASQWGWYAPPHLNPDSASRYPTPGNRHPTRYIAVPSHASRYAPGPLNNDDRFVGTPGDDYNEIPDNRLFEVPLEKRPVEDDTADEDRNLSDETFRDPSEKRSAVATALNAGRRRRQPAPALGKAVTPYLGVGVLNDVGSFFDSLRDNLESLASLSPQERASLFHDPPTVVAHAQAQHGGSGGGIGFRKMHALRPLRPTGNIRSYNRRSLVEAEGVYPGANNHDPGLLWTGLGR